MSPFVGTEPTEPAGHRFWILEESVLRRHPGGDGAYSR